MITAAAFALAIAVSPTPTGQEVADYCEYLADFAYAVALAREEGTSRRALRSLVHATAEENNDTGGRLLADLLDTVEGVFLKPTLEPIYEAAFANTNCLIIYDAAEVL